MKLKLELSENLFKTAINMLWVKADTMQRQIVNVKRLIVTLRKNQKEVLKVKNTNRN